MLDIGCVSTMSGAMRFGRATFTRFIYIAIKSFPFNLYTLLHRLDYIIDFTCSQPCKACQCFDLT